MTGSMEPSGDSEEQLNCLGIADCRRQGGAVWGYWGCQGYEDCLSGSLSAVT